VKLADIPNAHTITMASSSELIISSDNGLYHYNMVNQILSLLIKGVEFNRQAIFKDNEIIHVGSINGLYSFDVKNIPALIASNASDFVEVSNYQNSLYILLIFVLVLLVMLYLVLRYKKRLKLAEQNLESYKSTIVTVTREDIEAYLKENLADASIISLAEKFEINMSQLYDILKPDRPGSIIQQIRLDVVRNMRQEGKSTEDIAKATGLSASYVKKIKNKV
jgi:AraC-like DNA-binding protein